MERCGVKPVHPRGGSDAAQKYLFHNHAKATCENPESKVLRVHRKSLIPRRRAQTGEQDVCTRGNECESKKKASSVKQEGTI